MNKIIKKITAICLTVLTVFSFVSANNGMFVQNVYADGIVRGAADSFQPISYKVGNATLIFSLDKGKFYHDKTNSRFLFNYDNVFRLNYMGYNDIRVSKTGTGILKVDHDEGGCELSYLQASFGLEITVDGVAKNVSILDIIKSAYPDVQELVFVAIPSLSNLKISTSGNEYNGYLSKSCTISVGCDYTFIRSLPMNKGLPIDEYNINVKVNGVNVPNISAGDGKISTESISIADEKYGMNGKTGNFNISVSMEDKLGNVSTLSDTIKVDLAPPTIVEANAKWVDGADGKTYMGTGDSGKPTISFKVSDLHSGVKTVKVKSGSSELPLSVNGGLYTVDFSGLNEVTPVFYVQDNSGNIGEYYLKNVLGSSSNAAIIGLPLPSVDFNLEGGTMIGDWYKGNSLTLKATATNNLGGISKVVYKIGNKEEVTSNVSGVKYQFSENVTHLADNNGILDVSVSVYDNNSNVHKVIKQFKIDNVEPVLNNKSISGKYSVYDKTAYVNGELTIYGEVSESESGLKSVKVYKDGNEVGNSLPYNISDSGEYSVKLVDNVGNEKVYNLSDFFGKDVDNIAVSKNTPSISIESLSGGVKIDGIDWYKSLDTVKYSVKCDNLLSTEVKVKNGSSETKLEPIKGTGESYSVSLKGLKDGINTITFKVKDKSGLETSKELVIAIDSSKPIVNSVKVEDSYIDQFGFLWFKEEPTVTIDASDSLTDIKEYIVIGSDGERIENNNKVKLSAGDHAIKAVDSVGNVSDVVELKDMWNSESGIIAVDGDKPIIDCTKPDGNVKGWYSKDVTFKASVSDNLGINSATLTINGVEVDSLDVSKLILSGNVSGSTAGISPKEDGSYDIKIVVSDHAGNTSEWSDIIYIDKKASSEYSTNTGDNSQIVLWIALLFVSGGILIFYKKKKYNKS